MSWLLFLTCRLLPFIQSHRLWFLFIRLRLLRQLYLTVRSTTEIKLRLQKSKVSSSCFVTFKGWRIFSVWNHTTSARNLLTRLQVEVVWFTGQTEGEKNGLTVFWLTWFTTALCNTWGRCTGSAMAKCINYSLLFLMRNVKFNRFFLNHIWFELFSGLTVKKPSSNMLWALTAFCTVTFI